MSGRQASAQDFSAWANSINLTFNTTSTGAGVTGSVADFPVLIRLDSGNFLFSQARSDGGDLRFSEPDGVTSLPYQIERWDAGAKRAEIWVRVPWVDGNSKTDFIRMYWGNPEAISTSDGKAVFNADGGYASVWHLNGDFSDATANANLGRNAGTTDASGMIASGRAFNGTSQYVTAPSSASLNMANTLSLSAWIKADTWLGGNAGFRRIIRKGAGSIQYQLIAEGDSLAMWIGNARVRCLGPTLGAWHHVFATYDGDAMRLYIDGALKRSIAATGTIVPTSDSLRIGGKPGSPLSTDHWDGDIDEAVVSGKARSSDWIKLSYANQRASQTLVVIPTLDPVSCNRQFGTSGNITLIEGAKSTLTGTAECSTGYGWEIVSGPAPLILDPDVKVLPILASRAITKDTVVIYRFTARFGDSIMTKDVKVAVMEAIPDPIFTLPVSLEWDGQDTTVIIQPSITNLTAVNASSDSVIHFDWSLSGVVTDTAWVGDELRLKKAYGDGLLNVKLCLDNGGPALCKSAVVNVKMATVGLRHRPFSSGLGPWQTISGRDLSGRQIRAAGRPGRNPFPLFSKP